MTLRSILYVLTLILACAGIPARGQTEGTLHFMNSLPQVVYNNPAFVPKHKFSIGLPGSSTMAYYANNGFSYNSLVSKSAEGTYIDLDKLAKSMSDKNYITNAASIDLFRLSFKTGHRFYWNYKIASKTYNRIMLPQGALALFSSGNSSFINTSTNISPKIEAFSYLESSLGTSILVNEKLSLGVNIKWLKGLANVTTETFDLNILLDENYNITANAHLDIRTSGVNAVGNEDFAIKASYKDYLKNNGFAFDLGGTYRVFNKLTLGLSLVDIGAIRWKNDLKGYQIANGSTYTFKGINIDSLFDGGFGQLISEMDTLKARFTPAQTEISSYVSMLPSKVFFSADLAIRKNFTTGLVVNIEKMKERVNTSLTLGMNKHLGKHFSTALSYTISNKSYNNFGAGLSLNFSPFQFYILGDNLLAAPYALATQKELNPYLNSLQYFTIRTGLNIVWGWNHGEKKKTKRKIAFR